jgi:hypothetical protein
MHNLVELDKELEGRLQQITVKFLRSYEFKLWRAEEAAQVLALEACLLCGEKGFNFDRVFERVESSNKLLSAYTTDFSLESIVHCVEPHALESIVHIYPWFLSFIVAVDNLPIAVSIASIEIKDEELKCPIIYANKQFESLVHYPLELILGKESSFFLRGKFDDVQGKPYMTELEHAIKSRTLLKNLYRSPCGNERLFRNFIVSKPMYSHNEECEYVITIHHDVENFSDFDQHEFSKSFVHVLRSSRSMMRILPSIIPMTYSN